MKITKAFFEKIRWSIFTFIYVFAPPVVPYPHLILAVFAMGLLLTNYRYYWFKVFKGSSMKMWMFGMIVLAAYVVILPLPVSMFMRDLVNTSHYISLINRFAVLMVTAIPCVGLLLVKIEKERKDYHFMIEVVIYAGIMQGICAIIAFVSPTVKNFFVALMRQFTGAGLYSNTWYITVRSYGFSRTLVDVFGLGIALIAGLSFFYGIVEKKRYMFYSVVIAIATVLNSRTGVLVYLVGVVIALIYMLLTGKLKFVTRSIGAILVLIFFAVVILNVIATNQYTSVWFDGAINSIVYFFKNRTFSGNADDSLGNLFIKQGWEMPNIFRTIIGTGHSLYGADGYKHSDVGYINDIWAFGILGCCLLYGMLIKRACYIYKKSTNLLFKFVAIFLVFSFVVFNIKGSAIGYNPGAAVMFLLLFGLKYLTVAERKFDLTKEDCKIDKTADKCVDEYI